MTLTVESLIIIKIKYIWNQYIIYDTPKPLNTRHYWSLREGSNCRKFVVGSREKVRYWEVSVRGGFIIHCINIDLGTKYT